MHHAFFVHFFAVPAQLPLEMTSNFKFFLNGNNKAINSTTSVWTRGCGPLSSVPTQPRPQGAFPWLWRWGFSWTSMWCFHGRRRCLIVRSLFLGTPIRPPLHYPVKSINSELIGKIWPHFGKVATVVYRKFDCSMGTDGGSMFWAFPCQGLLAMF